jgi:hypothetical protein
MAAALVSPAARPTLSHCPARARGEQCAELARHKPGRHTADDANGYHRVTCPATAGKIRCSQR